MSAAREQLLDLMSEVSEEHYCAGWMEGLERDLYRRAFCGDDPKYAGFPIRAATLARLRALAEECGGWWSWADEYETDEYGETFITLEEAARRWGDK